jgi:hypothetical protein
MPAISEKSYELPAQVAATKPGQLDRWQAVLNESFAAHFAIWDAASCQLLLPAAEGGREDDALIGLIIRALSGSEPQFIAEEDPVSMLAIPLEAGPGERFVATATFVIRPASDGDELENAAVLLGLPLAKAREWIAGQEVWSAQALVRVAAALQARIKAETRATQLTIEIEKVSDNLAATYEEICLLHGVTQKLRIGSNEEQLSSLILGWLVDCLPAAGAAIQLLPVAEEGHTTYKARTKTVLYTSGNCPLDNDQFSSLVTHIQQTSGRLPFVANPPVTTSPDWPLPTVRQVVVVPMAEGDRILGWLGMFNHIDGAEFGTVEASLVNSIGSIIGIHSSNRDLYRQQSEFLASVVRALTSAIDAKDEYTCGHSDRVARIAVRLAKELNCDAELLHTLYMAGLLHDIGKIGVNDAVLRKSGRLTDAEFEHIKQHPALGHRILADIRPLAEVLPAVLHHHEQWDGRGYPLKLAGEQIPLIARIVAVADAYDAMSSDRPYRRGMELSRVEELFRAGAGKQWDAAVIDAYFTARDDIQQIARETRANLTLDVEQWS